MESSHRGSKPNCCLFRVDGPPFSWVFASFFQIPKARGLSLFLKGYAFLQSTSSVLKPKSRGFASPARVPQGPRRFRIYVEATRSVELSTLLTHPKTNQKTP